MLRLLMIAAVTVVCAIDDDYYSLRWPGPERGCAAVAGLGGKFSAECTLPTGRLTVTVDAAGSYLKIVCQDNTTFTCEDLHEAQQLISDHVTLPPHSNRTVDRFELSNCPLPADPLRCVLALAAASDATMLLLNDVSGTVTAHSVEGMTAVQKLRIYYKRGENQTTMPYDVLAKLPAVSSFSLKRGAVVLAPSSVEPLGAMPPVAVPPGAVPSGAVPPGAMPALRSLELAEGGLRSVPQGAFRMAPGLVTLALWGNEIDEIDEDAFADLSSVVNLSLNSNRLSSLPRALLRPCSRLEHVDLYDNQLTSLPRDLFQGLMHLREVVIFANKAPLHLPDHLFSNLPSLKHLELKISSIQSIPDHIFQNSTNMEQLYLSKNNLTSIPMNLFHGMANLTILDLGHNRLKDLHNKLFWNLTKLENLDLRGNMLERFPKELFTGLKGLKVLNLRSNQIETLDKSTFNGLSQLRELHLSENRIQILHSEIFAPISELKILLLAKNELSITRQVNTVRYITPEMAIMYKVNQTSVPADAFEYHSPLRELSSLTKLDLSHNRVSLVCDDWRNMWNMDILDLSYNQFTELTGSDMAFMSEGVTVDLTHNNITYFQPPLYTPGDSPHKTSPTFLLDHNPFVCDCNMYPYVEMRENNKLKTNIVIDSALCSQPLSLYNVYVTDLNSDQLICNDTDCPENCTCVNRPAKSTVEVDCLQLPTNLPQKILPTHLRLRESSDLTQLPSHIKYVDLSSLNLTRVPKISNPIEVDLSKNQLTNIPIDLLKLNCVLHLSNNPIDCSCKNRDELEFLKLKHHLVQDYRNLTCESKQSLSGIDIDTLCTARDSTIIGCTIALIGVLVAVVTGIAYQYKTEIRILLRKYGLWCGEDDTDDREYDVFISFSHQDERYVIDTLVPKLETGRNPLKLCLHYRDWVIGDFIPSQIARSVENSRRTIIVLSKHFLESVWAQMEFRAAHGREKLLILMLDDLTSDKNLDPDLKAYISVNTYVKADDPLVFDRLKDAVLSTRSSFGKKVKNVDRPLGLDVHLNAQGQLVNAYAA